MLEDTLPNLPRLANKRVKNHMLITMLDLYNLMPTNLLDTGLKLLLLLKESITIMDIIPILRELILSHGDITVNLLDPQYF